MQIQAASKRPLKGHFPYSPALEKPIFPPFLSPQCFIVMAASCLWVCVFCVCRPTSNPVFTVTPQQLISKVLLLNHVCLPAWVYIKVLKQLLVGSVVPG